MWLKWSLQMYLDMCAVIISFPYNKTIFHLFPVFWEGFVQFTTEALGSG